MAKERESSIILYLFDLQKYIPAIERQHQAASGFRNFFLSTYGKSKFLKSIALSIPCMNEMYIN